MKRKISPITFILLASFALASCNGSGDSTSNNPDTDTSINASTVIAKTTILPGDICPTGGIQIDSGIDENGNGVLDSIEIDNSEVVCHGNDGLVSLINIITEMPGENCPSGGSKIETGLDININAELDVNEINQVSFICGNDTPLYGGFIIKGEPTLSGVDELLWANTANSIAPVTLVMAHKASQKITDYKISPDRKNIAYRISESINSTIYHELYIRALSLNALPVKVAGDFNLLKSTGAYNWSPDGSRLAFNDDNGLNLAFANGHGITNLATTNNLIFQWSPDGRYIAYRNSKSIYTINVSDPSTSSPEHIVIGDHDSIKWSPDSQWLICSITTTPVSIYDGLYTCSPDGLTQNLLIGNVVATPFLRNTYNFSVMKWTADSTQIVIIMDTNYINFDETCGLCLYNSRYELFKANITDAQLTKINKPLIAPTDLINNGGNVTSFSISFDGQKIAYLADEAIDNIHELFMVDFSGQNHHRVNSDLDVNTYVEPSYLWSPDSQNIAYTTNQNDLWIADTNNTKNQMVMLDKLIQDGGLTGAFLDTKPFKWSSDSQHLVYIAMIERSPDYDLYNYNLTDNTTIKLNDTLPEPISPFYNGVMNFLLNDSNVIYQSLGDLYFSNMNSGPGNKILTNYSETDWLFELRNL